MKPPKTMYAYWDVDHGAKFGHWMIYETPEEAASKAEGSAIYELTAKRLGCFRVKMVLERLKKRKKR
jgi:hypothetical protein